MPENPYGAPESPQEFAKRLNLPFKDMRLLLRALSHRSYANEHPEVLEDNERLEFLGDAVLDFLVGEWLYHHFPEMDEGALTRLRAALVCGDQLAEFAKQIGLDNALLLGHGEDAGGGRQRPTLLAAAFEAVVGALYLDSGLEAVRNFVIPLLKPATERILAQHLDEDPKSRLQEIVQARGYPSPTYRTVKVSGPDHDRTFEIEVLVGDIPLGYGSGPNKRAATKAAAQQALIRLEQEALLPQKDKDDGGG